MSNEFYEFARIALYPFAAVGLIYLGVVVKKCRLALYAIAFQWILRGALLVVQVASPAEYREISNQVSTPTLFITIILIFLNLWHVRKD